MFAPALRQSNVVTSGSGSSVSWADNAGHATTADSATTAASASAAPWTGITGKPATVTVAEGKLLLLFDRSCGQPR